MNKKAVQIDFERLFLCLASLKTLFYLLIRSHATLKTKDSLGVLMGK